MKGMAVVPAVLTLHSGKAMALHSVYHCIGKGTDVNPPTPVRQRDGTERMTVDGNFEFFEDDRFLRVPCDPDNNPATEDLCAIYVDETGANATINPTMGEEALTDSCYDSFI